MDSFCVSLTLTTITHEKEEKSYLNLTTSSSTVRACGACHTNRGAKIRPCTRDAIRVSCLARTGSILTGRNICTACASRRRIGSTDTRRANWNSDIGECTCTARSTRRRSNYRIIARGACRTAYLIKNGGGRRKNRTKIKKLKKKIKNNNNFNRFFLKID